MLNNPGFFAAAGEDAGVGGDNTTSLKTYKAQVKSPPPVMVKELKAL